MTSLRGRVAVVGAAESDLGFVPGKSAMQLMVQAALAALEDAGLSKSDVDGVLAVSPYHALPSLELAEYMGIRARYTDSTSIGGCSVITLLEHAAAAISAGLCETAIVAYAATQRSDLKRRQGAAPVRVATRLQLSPYEEPFGPLFPISSYALAAQRHMDEFGTRPEQLAEIAVAARRWAALNPKAFARELITIDDVLASDLISTPLHALDCCLVTDGGGAIVVTGAHRAHSLRKPPVFLLGIASAHAHLFIHQMHDLVRTLATDTAERAFAMARLQRSDIDVVQIYDAFTISVLMGLEDLGFCPKGEGGSFVAGGALGPGGHFPINTSGGGLSYCHPGQFGIFLLIEAVRQLRRECGERQLPKAETALVHGYGGLYSAHATAIFGREPS